MKNRIKKRYIYLGQKYAKYELLFSVAKSLFYDLRNPLNVRFFFFKFYISQFKYTYIKFSNTCLLSQSTRGILTFLRSNRLMLKKDISFGLWSGIRKSSW